MTKNFIPEVLLLLKNSDLTHMAALAYSRQLQKGIPTAKVCLVDLFVYGIALLGFSP